MVKQSHHLKTLDSSKLRRKDSMASRRRHHHGCSHRQNHHDYIPLIATSSRCCDSNYLSPSPDNLLHLLASFLQNQPQERQQCLHHQKNPPREYDHSVVSCLLRKIDDLESSLNEFSARYDQRRDRYSTLRDSAARVIQTRFRSYLVRRSISFRHLKELALIKSSFLSLKSSVSGKPYFPFKAVSRKATDLLLQLDSIQGRVDPMIRNSKRSLSRDLVRFLQYIDDCAIERFDLVSKSTVNVRFSKKPQGFGVAEDRTTEKLRNRIGKLFVSSGEDEDNTDNDEDVPVIVKRKVGSSRSRIGEVVKGNEPKRLVRKPVVYGDTHELTSSAEDDDSVDGGEESVMMSRDSGIRHSSKTRNMVLVKNKVGKTVSFDEDGNIYKVYGDTTTESSVSEENESTSGSNDGNEEEKGNGNVVGESKHVPKETNGVEEEETDSENEVASSEGSEGDAIVTKNVNHPGNYEHKGSLMFSPPLPLKMEP